MDYYVKLPDTPTVIYPNIAAFPVSAPTGSLAVDASTGNLYEFNGTSWVLIASPGTYSISPTAVLYANSAGAPTGDSTSFYWNDSTQTLGIKKTGSNSGPCLTVGNVSLGVYGYVGVIAGGGFPIGIFGEGGDGLSFGSNNIEHMRLNTSGNLGINTTAPGALLDLNSNSTSIPTARITGVASQTSLLLSVLNSSLSTVLSVSPTGTINMSGLTASRVVTTDASSNLTTSTPGGLSYTPGNSADWVAPPPTTIQQALDRIAAAVGGVTPIP
jgi:hypothetical protein